MRATILALALCVCSLAGAQVPARESTERFAALAGVIRDSLELPIPLATVTADAGDLSTVSDSLGRFHLPGIPAGENTFTVMRIGFRATTFSTTLAPDSTLVITVHLRRVPTLDPVAVKAAAVSARLAKRGFYDRQRRGLGTFLTPEHVDSLSYRSTPAQLLREVPGLLIWCAKSVGRCEVRMQGPSQCLQLFVNGHIYKGQLDDAITTQEVGAIEVYQRPAIVPIEFQGPLPKKTSRVTERAGCGAIVVWTR